MRSVVRSVVRRYVLRDFQYWMEGRSVYINTLILVYVAESSEGIVHSKQSATVLEYPTWINKNKLFLSSAKLLETQCAHLEKKWGSDYYSNTTWSKWKFVIREKLSPWVLKPQPHLPKREFSQVICTWDMHCVFVCFPTLSNLTEPTPRLLRMTFHSWKFLLEIKSTSPIK